MWSRSQQRWLPALDQLHGFRQIVAPPFALLVESKRLEVLVSRVRSPQQWRSAAQALDVLLPPLPQVALDLARGSASHEELAWEWRLAVELE